MHRWQVGLRHGPVPNVSAADVIALWNHPYSHRKGSPRPAHTGLLIVAASAGAMRVLARWWHSHCCAQYDVGRDWDQGTWNELLRREAAVKV